MPATKEPPLARKIRGEPREREQNRRAPAEPSEPPVRKPKRKPPAQLKPRYNPYGRGAEAALGVLLREIEGPEGPRDAHDIVSLIWRFKDAIHEQRMKDALTWPFLETAIATATGQEVNMEHVKTPA